MVTQIKQRLLQLQDKSIWWLFEEHYDLYYVTGLKLSKGSLMVGPKIALFVDGRYLEAATQSFPFEVLPIERMIPWCQQESIQDLRFDGGQVSYERYLSLSKHMTLHPSFNPVQFLRMIKSAEEICAIERSTELLMQGFKHILGFLKVGVQEKEIAKAFEIYCLQHGAEKMAFEPIIAFGPHSALPHYRAGKGVLKKGDVVLIDIGVVVDDYASDMTRTLLFGNVSQEITKAYEVVLGAYKEVLSNLHAGTKVQKLDQIYRHYLSSNGNYPVLHGLGHSLGLEVHEYPRVSIQTSQEVVLQNNMIVTIEPGIYLPGIGGVRHEDLFLVQEKGARNFYERLEVDRIIV